MPLILNVNQILLYNHMLYSLLSTVPLTFSFDVVNKKIIAHLETVTLDKYQLRIPYNDQRSDNSYRPPLQNRYVKEIQRNPRSNPV